MTDKKLDIRAPISTATTALASTWKACSGRKARCARAAASWATGSPSYRAEHPAGRLQVQGLPRAVRHGRHRHGAFIPLSKWFSRRN